MHKKLFAWLVVLCVAANAQETSKESLYREIAERFNALADLEGTDTPTPSPNPSPDPDPDPPAPTHRPGVGINMTSAHSWDDLTIYKNAFKETRWVTEYRGSEYVQEIPVDETGWPSVAIPHDGKRLFGSVEINADLPIVNNQEFVLYLEGKCKLKIAGVGTFECPALALRYSFKFPDNTQTINVEIESAEVGSRWHLFYPGEEYNPSQFHSFTLESLQKFGVIRFMDWTKTNGSIQKTWGDSNNPLGMSESSDTGSSWQSACDLANETSSDMWVCIPHGVDLEYTRTLAKLLAAQFKGDRIYVEYSNECWNFSGAFRAQLDFCKIRGQQVNPSETDLIKQIVTGYADLSGQHFAAFKSAYQGNASVDYVLAWQSTASWSPKLAMDLCPNETAVAHAPYIFVSGSAWKTDSIDSVFTQLNIEGLERCRKDVAKWKAWADERGLKYMIYECGHHIGGSDHTYEIARDERMKQLLIDFDKLLPADTVRCYFNYGGLPRRNFDFGHMSFSGDTDKPTWQGLQEILKQSQQSSFSLAP